MNKRLILWGATLWLALLVAGGKWISAPWLWTPPPGRDLAALEATGKHFPMHLTALANSGLRGHAERLASEDLAPPPDFDYYDWAFRETRARFIYFFALWVVSGLFTHWLAGRILREPREMMSDS